MVPLAVIGMIKVENPYWFSEIIKSSMHEYYLYFKF